ncbi:MAG TPA: hypothetical protein VD907_04180 [Verrucomicrobiae bacterium]|nr:hypothetical protein [Verrucomicrobiae bacterium]
MNKTDFKEFTVGTVFNTVEVSDDVSLRHNKLTVGYPSRLEAMALDPAKISDNNNLIYEAGQIDFCVSIFKHTTVEVDQTNSDISITERSPRKALIMHAALLMKAALKFKHGLKIDVDDATNLKHCGLGSSSSLIAGTAAAINELYGKPIKSLDLVKYCAQNHGEEVEGDDSQLAPVQCIGGSGVCGHFEGGLIILAGQATPIYTFNIPDDMSVVIGIPSDFTAPDSRTLLEAEVDNMEGFRTAGNTYGKEIAYRLVHQVMPALSSGDLSKCKELIFDYRWDMGSIKNCSFVYPGLVELAEKMRPLKDDSRVEILSLSSVGPGFFALTKDLGHIEEEFRKLDLKTIVTTIHNNAYSVAVER